MPNPTTIRLDDETRERLRKLALLHGSQADALRQAVELLWQRDGERAEQVAKLVKQP